MNYWENDLVQAQTELICSSFETLLCKKLVQAQTLKGRAEELYNAPFVVVAHDTAIDPIFFYANLAAQKLWNLPLDEFLKTPSRYTVEPMEVSERQKLLDRAKAFGFVDDYTGVRVRQDGSKFEIGTTILWNLTDAHGVYSGQAATFSEWKELR